MYYVQKRTTIPVGYEYSTKEVTIPRCKACHYRHDHFWGGWVGIIILVSMFVLLLWWLYDPEEGGWWYLSWIFGCGLLAVMVAGLVGIALEFLFFKMTTGIPPESEIEEYPVIREMLKAGWVKSRPDPASHPETGEEGRER